jgi:flavin-dependent dehydrogenase
MLATRLAAAGCEVVLLEKRREPHHKVCGEFLSAEAIEYLGSVGIDPHALGAHPIKTVQLHVRRKSIRASLPFAALSLSRLVLDEALLQRAKAAGCKVQKGVLVERLLNRGDSFSIHLRGGQIIHTNNVFLSTGKHDVAEQPRGQGSHRGLVGFKMHWKLTPEAMDAVRHSMELFLFRNGYGGFALIENNIANLCFVIHQHRVRALGGWSELLSAICDEVPALEQILCGATQCWPKPLAISPIPYGYFSDKAAGIWRIGDQAAVIPSFTGDGMSIALHSAGLASEMYLAGRTPDDYLACLRGQLRSGMRFASMFSRIMVTSAGRMLAPCCLSVAPGMMGWIAAQTRIPDGALNTTRIPARHSPAPAA